MRKQICNYCIPPKNYTNICLCIVSILTTIIFGIIQIIIFNISIPDKFFRETHLMLSIFSFYICINNYCIFFITFKHFDINESLLWCPIHSCRYFLEYQFCCNLCHNCLGKSMFTQKYKTTQTDTKT